jgi:hypothetical protein
MPVLGRARTLSGTVAGSSVPLDERESRMNTIRYGAVLVGVALLVGLLDFAIWGPSRASAQGTTGGQITGIATGEDGKTLYVVRGGVIYAYSVSAIIKPDGLVPTGRRYTPIGAIRSNQLGNAFSLAWGDRK